MPIFVAVENARDTISTPFPEGCLQAIRIFKNDILYLEAEIALAYHKALLTLNQLLLVFHRRHHSTQWGERQRQTQTTRHEVGM